MKTTARLFKALSDETRLRIMCLLVSGELCVCDLMAVLQLPQSTVSRHLAYLKNSGLVDDRRSGVWMYYSLVKSDEPLFNELMRFVHNALPVLEVAVADRRRLKELSRGVQCA